MRAEEGDESIEELAGDVKKAEKKLDDVLDDHDDDKAPSTPPN